ncbi:hypothetical protein ONE63_010491 [Megalurothrips usitatus]|uniref:Ribosome biogenesis protein BOP1 homolog n=1 Tax=Megalurothrips usitatus TaxID=439358 RepID=A0AAV7XH46_9NEOP|nr:hypothetical protein ONE63_010491 [Megalurothrips usitatus]
MAPKKVGTKRKAEKPSEETKTNVVTAQNGDDEHEEVDLLQTFSDNDSSDAEGDDQDSDDSDGYVQQIGSDAGSGDESEEDESDEVDSEDDGTEDEGDSEDSGEDEEESEIDGSEVEGGDEGDVSELEWESDDAMNDFLERLPAKLKNALEASLEARKTSKPVKEQGSKSDTQNKTATDKSIVSKNLKKKSKNEKVDTKKSSVKEKVESGSEDAKKKDEGTKSDVKETEESDIFKDIERRRLDPSTEYESGDTSDEEDIRNTVGNVPMNWYDEYPHIGYDWDGKPILRPKRGDSIDQFLKRMEDPNFFRTVRDPQTGQDVVLSEADVELIKRIQSGQIPDAAFDDEAPWVEYFTSEVMQTPISNIPPSKKSFLPSKHEADKVSYFVSLLKARKMKTKMQRAIENAKKRRKKFYMIWGMDDNTVEPMRRIHNNLTAPKRLLPGHNESYNPPAEYLFNEQEMKQWNLHEDNFRKRKLHFLPQKYNSLREVPAWDRYVRERFLRCMDLYMAPRGVKDRLLIEAEDLIPKLPSPRDLQPFPTTMSMVYEGHTDMVRTITVDGKGQFMISGSDDMTIKVWEVSTGRCMRTINVGGIVRSVCWCPNQALSLVAVAADRKLLLINPGVGDNLVVAKTDSLLKELPEDTTMVPERVKAAIQWEQATSEEWATGIRVVMNHFKEIKQVTWHGRGDYFATVMPEGENRSVIIHQLSKRRSQIPFSRSRGLVQCALFHPIRPMLFVATQKHVRVYDLVKQVMAKKLMTYAKWISSMAIHPGGDNLLVGTYDKKIMWFDLDLSTNPYKTLRVHYTAVRGVAIHKRYPLFASASDDKYVVVSHGMVYNDLNKNPLIVPLKRLQYHESYDDFGIFDVVFHPTQPWVFSAGADKTIRLCT